MQFDVIETKCPCCGRVVKRKIIKSSYRNDAGLDQKPESEGLIPEMFECPACHYCTANIKNAVDYIVQAFVRNAKYQSKMSEISEYPEERRIIAAMEFTEDRKMLADLWMILCWRREFRSADSDALDARKNAVLYQEDILAEESDPDMMLQYIDNLRRLELWDKGKITISKAKTAEEFGEDDFYRKIIEFEEILFDQKDKKQHMISEALAFCDKAKERE